MLYRRDGSDGSFATGATATTGTINGSETWSSNSVATVAIEHVHVTSEKMASQSPSTVNTN